MAKKRATKRKSASLVAENDENHAENNNVENGVESTSKTAKKKKSVGTPKSTAKNGTSSTRGRPSKNKSEVEEEGDDDQEYEVEKILDVKYKKNNKREFLIRWKNFSPKHDTWEAENNLACDELIAKFLEEQEKNKNDQSKSESEGEDEEYEVEKILDVKHKRNDKREFLIRWKNYSSKHDTWEAEENLACDELIAEFLKNHDQSKSKQSKSEDEEEDKDYEVEKILDVNYKKNNKREFLIRWKNYSSKHDTWEPEENLDCDELITKFLEVQEQRSKQPRKELRERPKTVSRYAAPGNRKSKRTAGNRKSYAEEDDE